MFANRALVALTLLGASVAAQAQAIDVTDVVADVAAQAVPIGLIGSAVLLLVVAIKAFKWVRRAL